MENVPTGPVTMNVERMLGQTRLALQFQVPGGVLRPMRLLSLMRAVGDGLIKDATDRLPALGESVSCGAGCAACCHYLIPVSPIEARRLLEVVESMPPEVRAVIEARFAGARERLGEAGLLEALSSPASIAPEDLDALGDAYFAMNLPCPFLHESKCIIYRERPMPCREFLVVSPAALCSSISNPTIRKVKLAATSSMASAAVENESAFGGGGWVLLALALDWARSHPEPAPSLTGPEIMDRFFDALEQTSLRTPS